MFPSNYVEELGPDGKPIGDSEGQSEVSLSVDLLARQRQAKILSPLQPQPSQSQNQKLSSNLSRNLSLNPNLSLSPSPSPSPSLNLSPSPNRSRHPKSSPLLLGTRNPFSDLQLESTWSLTLTTTQKRKAN